MHLLQARVASPVAFYCHSKYFFGPGVVVAAAEAELSRADMTQPLEASSLSRRKELHKKA